MERIFEKEISEGFGEVVQYMGLESIHLSLDTPPAYDGGIFGEIGRLTVQGGMLDDDELPHPPPDDPGFQFPLIEETLDLNGYV